MSSDQGQRSVAGRAVLGTGAALDKSNGRTHVPCVLSHLGRLPDLLLAPPPHSGLSPRQHLEWERVGCGGQRSVSAGPPARPAHAQLSLSSPFGPTEQPGEVGRLSVLIPTLLMRKLSPGKGSGRGTFSLPPGWGTCQPEFLQPRWVPVLLQGRCGQSPPLLAAIPFPCHSAPACAGLAPEPALGSCLGLESEASDREAGQQGIGGGCNILFPGATVATAAAACLESLAVPTDVS